MSGYAHKLKFVNFCVLYPSTYNPEIGTGPSVDESYLHLTYFLIHIMLTIGLFVTFSRNNKDNSK